jgi:hypothetical protein
LAAIIDPHRTNPVATRAIRGMQSLRPFLNIAANLAKYLRIGFITFLVVASIGDVVFHRFPPGPGAEAYPTLKFEGVTRTASTQWGILIPN